MNFLEEIYSLVRIKENETKTSIMCSNVSHSTEFPFQMFYDVKIDCRTNLDPYKNKTLQMTLQVIKDDIIINWLLLKKSSVINGGLGIFALGPFKKEELVTVYLGEEIDKEN
jgi:hypothetical protein